MLMFEQGKLKGRVFDYYGRVSDVIQTEGKGLERQSEGLVWATRELGMTRGDVYEDPGRSGYKGHHRKRGEFKKYLQKVNRKEIKPGRVLVVEHFDRMGREQVIRVALPQFITLINAGIVICTFLDKMIYDQEILNSPLGPMMLQQSIMLMTMAHTFSKDRSQRRKNTNKQARDKGELVKGFLPRWLKSKTPGDKPEAPFVDVGHPDFFVDEVKASVVRLIFDLYLGQGMGFRMIAHVLNRRGIPTFTAHFKRKWRENVTGLWCGPSVRAIVINPAVTGTYQPGEWIEGEWSEDGEELPARHVAAGEPREGFFPHLISKARWLAAQLKRSANLDGGGNRGRTYTNLFANGLARCAHCGKPVYYAPATKTHDQFLVCSQYREHSRDGSNTKGCNHVLNYPLQVLEDQVFAVIRFMMDQQDPAIDAADDEPLAQALERLYEMQQYLEELEDYEPGDKHPPTRAIAKLKAQINKQEELVAELQPITANRLQGMIDARAKSQATNDDERKAIRCKLADDLSEVLDTIKIYGRPNTAGRRPSHRAVEIFWQPQQGVQLMIRWQLRHLNGNQPAYFDGVFMVDPETKLVERQLTSDVVDVSVLHEVTAQILGNPKLQEWRAKASEEHIHFPRKVPVATFEGEPCKLGHTTRYANGICVECHRAQRQKGKSQRTPENDQAYRERRRGDRPPIKGTQWKQPASKRRRRSIDEILADCPA